MGLIGPASRLPPLLKSPDAIREPAKAIQALREYIHQTVESLLNRTVGIRGLIGLSGTGTPANNLRGNVTITGTATSSLVSFSAAESNASYFLILGAQPGIGSPPQVAALYQSPTATTVNLLISAAPGTSNSIIVNWALLR